MASYNDGSTRDVTSQTVFLTNNESTASVDEHGVIRSIGKGTAFILARFDQFTEGASVIVRPGTPLQFPDLPEENFIDKLVHQRLRELNLLPSELSDDEMFLRRVSIDLLGQLPTPDERQQFLQNLDPNKRKALVSSMAKRPEFLDLWTMQWAEMLQLRSNNGISPKALWLYDRWLRERVHEGRSIDTIVRELLPANGGTFENPPANYFQTETSPQLIAESVAQAFLGTRIQCAQCHNHPFDRWTMDDYYGFASFFARVGYKQAADPRELTIFDLGNGELAHPVQGRKVQPTFLGSTAPEFLPGENQRLKLAEWIASKENMAFARNIANRVWAHFFGIGIVDPVDDFRVSNPPSNPNCSKYWPDDSLN